MTLTVSLPADAERKLKERALAAGEDIQQLAARLLQEALAAPSVEELLSPFRKQVAESGLSDAELDSMFEGLRDEVWQEKKRA